MLDRQAKWLEAYNCKVYWNLETGEVTIEPGSHIHGFTREPEPWEDEDKLEVAYVFPDDLGEDTYKRLMVCQHSYKPEDAGQKTEE